MTPAFYRKIDARTQRTNSRNRQYGPGPRHNRRESSETSGTHVNYTQQLVILAVAVVMVLIMWLTGGTKRTNSASRVLPEARVLAPNPATVEDFKETIQKQQAAARQPISPSNLQRLQGLRLACDVPAGQVIAPPADADGPQPGGLVGGNSAQQPPPDPIKEDQKKREYLSLFAPNVAFTSRKSQEDLHPPLDTLMPQGEGQAKPAIEGISQQSRPNSHSTTSPNKPDAFTGGEYVAFEGTVVETLLINRLNGTFAGPVSCSRHDTRLFTRSPAHSDSGRGEGIWRSEEGRGFWSTTTGGLLPQTHHAGRIFGQPRPVQGPQPNRGNRTSGPGEQRPISKSLEHLWRWASWGESPRSEQAMCSRIPLSIARGRGLAPAWPILQSISLTAS